MNEPVKVAIDQGVDLRKRAAAFLLALSLTLPYPLAAQQDSVKAEVNLRLSSAPVVTVNLKTGRASLCQGFTFDGDPTYSFASLIVDLVYVVTAKHCIDSVTSKHFGRDLDLEEIFQGVDDGSPTDLGETICVTSSVDKERYRADRLYWNSRDDAVVLRVAAPPLKMTPNIQEMTKQHRRFWLLADSSQFKYWTDPLPQDGIPVMSMLSAGGGQPIPSSGIALRGPNDVPVLILPVAPGTSGSLVVDLAGAMVGMVVAESTYVPQGASFAA